MNKELKEDDRAIKISMPLLTEKEMLEIDNNFNEIVNEVSKHYIKEKDLAIAQYIIGKQQKELEQKESILNRVTDILKEDIDKYNKELLKDSIMSIKNTDLTARILQSQKILNIIEGEKK